MHNDSDLVYSTNQQQNTRCKKCKKLLVSCNCRKSADQHDLDPRKMNVTVRLERAHRGGKDVTVIDRLAPSEPFLKDLARQLKKKCGSGGTFKIREERGIVEVQGDKQEEVKKVLGAMGIRGNWG